MSNNEMKQEAGRNTAAKKSTNHASERIQCLAGIVISIIGLVALLVLTFMFVKGGMSLLVPMYVAFAVLVFGLELILAAKPYMIMGWTLVIALFPSLILTIKAVMMGSFEIGKLPEMICLGTMILFVIMFALSILSLVKNKKA